MQDDGSENQRVTGKAKHGSVIDYRGNWWGTWLLFVKGVWIISFLPRKHSSFYIPVFRPPHKLTNVLIGATKLIN